MPYPQSSTGCLASWRIINRRQAILRARAAIRRRATYYRRQDIKCQQKRDQPQKPNQATPDSHLQVVIQPEPSDPPPDLLNLPKEIKLQIAREVATIGARIIPQQELGWRYIPDANDQDFWAILRVNHQVHDDYEEEFLCSFYRRNLFHFCISARASRTIYNLLKLANVRHISLCFPRFDPVINRFDFSPAMALGDLSLQCPLLETLTIQFKPEDGCEGLAVTSVLVRGENCYDAAFGRALSALLPIVKNRLTIIAPDTPERFAQLRIPSAPSVQWLAKGQAQDDVWEDLVPRDYDSALPGNEELRAWTFRP